MQFFCLWLADDSNHHHISAIMITLHSLPEVQLHLVQYDFVASALFCG